MDLAETSKVPEIDAQRVDFGVVRAGQRRALNFVHDRRWFDDDRDANEAGERMYIGELKEFHDYLIQHTTVEEL